jgi:hypothetical protein
MAFIPKILGQVAPAAATYIVAYTVPSATNTTVSTITVSNANAAARTFRIYVMSAADVVTFGSTSPQAKHFIAFDVTVGATDTTVMTLGLTLAVGDIVGAYASAASSLAVNIYGSELT